jgi:hypothetical protein
VAVKHPLEPHPAIDALGCFARLYEHDPLGLLQGGRHPPAGRLKIFSFDCSGCWPNSRLEGTNNTLGVLNRTAYGFTNAIYFEA